MSKPVVLVTGKNGQVGNELQLLSVHYPQYQFEFTDVEELDITDQVQVETFFTNHKPVLCINAAAYTAVDKAETDQELAMKINATAAGILATQCRLFGSRMVHISTDYVFDGSGTEPYKENDPVSPVNFYGLTKLKGEEAVMAANPDSIIVRTAWVYSFFGNNFVKTMLRLMKERDTLNVVGDQFGSPTYAADLAAALLTIGTATEAPGGVYHYTNTGLISWFDFATAIRDLSGLSCTVCPIDTSAYPTPAKRPAYSVLSKDKIASTFQLELQPWKESLQRCLDLLNK